MYSDKDYTLLRDLQQRLADWSEHYQPPQSIPDLFSFSPLRPVGLGSYERYLLSPLPRPDYLLPRRPWPFAIPLTEMSLFHRSEDCS